MTTTTKPRTLHDVLNDANPNEIAAALAELNLGDMLTPIEEDTGTISASATIVLTKKALMVQSARVVTSGTAGSVGSYVVSDSAATVSTPTGASAQAGVAKIGTDRKTITFPNTVTRAIVTYLPIPDLTALFARS